MVSGNIEGSSYCDSLIDHRNTIAPLLRSPRTLEYIMVAATVHCNYDCVMTSAMSKTISSLRGFGVDMSCSRVIESRGMIQSRLHTDNFHTISFALNDAEISLAREAIVRSRTVVLITQTLMHCRSLTSVFVAAIDRCCEPRRTFPTSYIRRDPPLHNGSESSCWHPWPLLMHLVSTLFAWVVAQFRGFWGCSGGEAEATVFEVHFSRISQTPGQHER